MKKRIKILICFGTRPEGIKLAPILKLLEKKKDKFEFIVCSSGQHNQMLNQVLEFFEIVPDFDLKLMKGYGTIDIGSDPQGKGYSITVIDEKAKEYISSAKDVIKKYNKESEELLRFFGTYTPKSFELLATIHYVYKKMEDSLPGAKLKEEVVNRVSELKSSFSKDDISTQYDLLVKEGLLK